MVDASITHLLRTCLAKAAKDQTVNPSPLSLLKDTQKLKKHIALLCDRLSKGAKLVVEGQEHQPTTPTTNNSGKLSDAIKLQYAVLFVLLICNFIKLIYTFFRISFYCFHSFFLFQAFPINRLLMSKCWLNKK